MPVAFEGGCFCGEIRYRAKSVFDSGYCHCSMCRRFTGCPALTWFSVPEHWLFGIFAAICILVALASYVFAGRVEDGWIVGACISIAGWALVVHFAKHLDKASTNVRSNL